MRLVASTPNSKPVPESIRGLLATISPNQLREIVERISVPRPTGTAENEVVRQSIIELFSRTEAGQLGVKVDKGGNVVVGDPRRAKILIGAHYDSVPGTPGADDNASAVSALIAAAHVIGPQEQVCFVAFDGEECGFVGSRALVAGLGQHRPEQVHILEMVGYVSREPGSQRNPVPVIQAPTVGDFLGLVGTYGSRWPLNHVLATADSHAVPVQGLFLPNVPLEMIGRISHHGSAAIMSCPGGKSIPALMWTDTSEFRNPHLTTCPPTRRIRLITSALAAVTRLPWFMRCSPAVDRLSDRGWCESVPLAQTNVRSPRTSTAPILSPSGTGQVKDPDMLRTRGGGPCDPTLSMIRHPFEVMSKRRRGYPERNSRQMWPQGCPRRQGELERGSFPGVTTRAFVRQRAFVVR